MKAGDRIRYHQAPGGMLPHGDWRYGIAAHFPEDRRSRTFDPEELYLFDGERYYGIFGHVVERFQP